MSLTSLTMLSRTLPLCVLLIGIATSVAAQVLPTSDPGRSVRTRADLERLLEDYEQALASPAYSESVKQSIRADAEAVRGRLVNGDFRIGDRIVMSVQGEPDLPDTVAVESGPMIALPLFGEISLQGVLRSEITDHLTQALSRYIREPVVRANGLMRLSVQGAVGAPGFYTMPADMLLGEALMVAGGPSPDADMDGITIERGTQTLLEGETLQEAIRQGLTLDQLNLQAGDQIVVSQDAGSGPGLLRNVGIIASAIGSIVGLIFIFNR